MRRGSADAMSDDYLNPGDEAASVADDAPLRLQEAGESGGRRSLRAAAVSGVKWMSVAMITATAAQLLQFAILAHLLSPAEFGLLTLVLVVVSFGQSFVDVGLSNVIIARHLRDPNVLSSLYWANIAAGVAIALIVVVTAPAISAFFDEPDLKELLYWSSLVFVATAPGQQFQILLRRDLEFNAVALTDMIALVAGACVAIATATLGAGAVAFVWGVIATSIVRSLLLIGICRSRWRPELRLRFSEVRPHLGFGAFQLGERSINNLAANIDYIVIGRILGTAPLGAYMLAYQLVIQPIRKINPVLNMVAFPVFARRHSEDPVLARGFWELSKLLAFVSLPLLAGLAVLAPELVPIVFGGGWEQTVTLLVPLSIVGALKSLLNPSGSVYLAKNRPDIGFKLNVFIAIALGVVLTVAATTEGVLGVAWALVAVFGVVFAVTCQVLERLIGLHWREYMAALAAPLGLSAAAGGTALAARLVLEPEIASDLLLFVLAAAAGAVSFVVLAWQFQRSFVLELLRMALPGRRPRAAS
jgi:O-antigen/teichoic acid export membrane protein